jgi:hypothetical protein
MAGYQCAQYVGPPSLCQKFCYDNDDCAPPGGLCVLEFAGTGGGSPIMLCSHNCDLISGTGCQAQTMKCDLGYDAGPPEQWYTLCMPAGAAAQGEACTNTLDCADGLGCYQDPNTLNTVCMTYCNHASPQCPGTTTCLHFDPPMMIGSIEYGACLQI